MDFFKCFNMFIIIFIFFLSATPIFSDSSSTTSNDHLSTPNFLDLAKEPQVFDWMINIRRKIHENPELSYQEFETSKLIRTKLDELGISYKHPVAVTGVIGYIGTGLPPFVALRADMDALLMQVYIFFFGLCCISISMRIMFNLYFIDFFNIRNCWNGSIKVKYLERCMHVVMMLMLLCFLVQLRSSSSMKKTYKYGFSLLFIYLF